MSLVMDEASANGEAVVAFRSFGEGYLGLIRRAKSITTFQQTRHLIETFENYFISHCQ